MKTAKTLPLYVSALLKQRAFRIGVSTKLDDRLYDMERIKTLPLDLLMLLIYPELYPLHIETSDGHLPRLPLSFERVEKAGIYLLHTIDAVYIYVCGRAHIPLLNNIFGVSKFSHLPDNMVS